MVFVSYVLAIILTSLTYKTNNNQEIHIGQEQDKFSIVRYIPIQSTRFMLCMRVLIYINVINKI